MVQYFPVVTGSLTVTGSINVSGGITASGGISISGSIASASFASTASFVALAQSASNAVAAATASFANAFTVAGNLTAQTLVVQTITSSVDFVTGSTRFGSIIGNTHQFTGSISVSGSLINIGSIATSQSLYSVTDIAAGGATPLHLSYASSDGAGPAIRLGSGVQGFWDVQPSSNNQRLTFDWNDSVNVLNLLSSGNVGIGTTSPGDVLDVQKNQNATTNFYFRNTDTTNASSRAYLNVVAGSTTMSMLALHGGDTYLAGTSGRNMYFQQNPGGTVNMFISSSGNIGIGTSNPRTRLQVTPASNAETPVPGTATGVAIFTSANTNYGLQFNSTSDGSFHIQSQRFDGSATTYNLVLQPAGGNVSIGTSSNPEAWQNPGLKIYGSRPSIDLVNSGGGNLNSIRWYAPGATGRELHMNYSTETTMWSLRFNSYYLSGGAASHTFNGDGSMSIVGALTQNTSDGRVKKNKQTISNALAKISTLSGITFEWDKDIVPFMNRTTDVGVVAQEIQSVLPDAVTLAPFDINEQTGLSKSGENYLTVYYEKIIPLLIEGIKELNTKFEEYKATHP